MSRYNLSLHFLKHHDNRVRNQRLDKSVLATTGTSPTEKCNCIERYVPNLCTLSGG